MPKWNGLTLTNLGKNLQIKCQAGSQLVFTKVKLGEGIHDDGTILSELTDLKSIKQTVGITECKVNENQQCQISCIISNAGLESGYYLRELGLFAQDPEAGEILYAITLDENPDFLPEDGGSVTLSETFNVLINIGNISDVSAVIDVGGWATTGYVAQLIETHNNDPDVHCDMVGATDSSNGVRGFVPAPVAGNPKRCLHADGTWSIPTDTKYSTMEGASATAAGKGGLVPVPRAGQQQAYLRGDGTWEKPALQFYPVGSVYISVNNVSPASMFGGTWQQIKDRFLLGVGDTYRDVKQTGGESSHTLTINEMPVHNHSAGCSEEGSHTHSRGTMNITGSFGADDRMMYTISGAFYNSGGADTGSSGTGGGSKIGFDASRSWTGDTSKNGPHKHDITINQTGGSMAHNNMPPYFTVFMWVRLA